jgi:hypothetical protein
MGKRWKFPFYNLHTSYLTPVSRVMGGTGFLMLLILGKTEPGAACLEIKYFGTKVFPNLRYYTPNLAQYFPLVY